jgi:hypothetical protein
MHGIVECNSISAHRCASSVQVVNLYSSPAIAAKTLWRRAVGPGKPQGPSLFGWKCRTGRRQPRLANTGIASPKV